MNNRPSHLNSAYKTALSPRQREVLDLVAQGNTYGETAEALGITLDGVKWHMREVLAKLGVNSREEAVEWWQQEHSISRGLARFGRALAPLLGVRALIAGGTAAALAGIAIGGTMLTGWHFGGSAPASAPVVEGGAPPACVEGLTRFEFSTGVTDVQNGEREVINFGGGPYASWDDNPSACTLTDNAGIELMLDGEPLDVLGNGIQFQFRQVYEPQALKFPDGSLRTRLSAVSMQDTPFLQWTNWCGDHSQAATIHVLTDTYTGRDGKVAMPKCLDASKPSQLVLVERHTEQIPIESNPTVVVLDPDGTPTP